jgi:acetyl-CoA carboxylase biotin carboxyl carrier protein
LLSNKEGGGVKTIELKTEITGTVWKILRVPGDKVVEGDTVMIVESMKMEVPIQAPFDAVIQEIRVCESAVVNDGDTVAMLGL